MCIGLPDFLSIRYNSWSSFALWSRDLNDSSTLPKVISFKCKIYKSYWSIKVTVSRSFRANATSVAWRDKQPLHRRLQKTVNTWSISLAITAKIRTWEQSTNARYRVVSFKHYNIPEIILEFPVSWLWVLPENFFHGQSCVVVLE